MIRPSLANLPPVVLPEGYILRHFCPGDEASWNILMDAAFQRKPGETDFSNTMASDPVYLPERVRVIVDSGGKLVATASAWVERTLGMQRGNLHWVGTHPEHQGKQLGSTVSIAAMQYSRDEGRTSMALLTDDFRTAAIKTYLRLGFQPCCTHRSHNGRWEWLLESLSWPERFAEVLQGPLVQLDK